LRQLYVIYKYILNVAESVYIAAGGTYVNHATLKIIIHARYCNDITSHTRVTH